MRSESDEELRRTGIRSLGLVDSDEASAALVEIYGQSSDGEFERLSLMDDEAALEFMMEILEN